MNKIAGLCFGVLLMGASLGAYAEMTAPDVLIKNIAQEVLAIVKRDKDIQAGDRQKILALVDAKVLPNFDFERMTRLAVGRAWRDATPEQQQTLVAEFRDLLVNTYTNAFTRYKDQTLEVGPLQAPAGANEVTVKTRILKAGTQPVTVDYEMENTAEGWKVFDLSVDGISLVITYRGAFGDLVAQSGIGGLITSLTKKNASNNASH